MFRKISRKLAWFLSVLSVAAVSVQTVQAATIAGSLAPFELNDANNLVLALDNESNKTTVFYDTYGYGSWQWFKTAPASVRTRTAEFIIANRASDPFAGDFPTYSEKNAMKQVVAYGLYAAIYETLRDSNDLGLLKSVLFRGAGQTETVRTQMCEGTWGFPNYACKDGSLSEQDKDAFAQFVIANRGSWGMQPGLLTRSWVDSNYNSFYPKLSLWRDSYVETLVSRLNAAKGTSNWCQDAVGSPSEAQCFGDVWNGIAKIGYYAPETPDNWAYGNPAYSRTVSTYMPTNSAYHGKANNWDVFYSDAIDGFDPTVVESFIQSVNSALPATDFADYTSKFDSALAATLTASAQFQFQTLKNSPDKAAVAYALRSAFAAKAFPAYEETRSWFANRQDYVGTDAWVYDAWMSQRGTVLMGRNGSTAGDWALIATFVADAQAGATAGLITAINEAPSLSSCGRPGKYDGEYEAPDGSSGRCALFDAALNEQLGIFDDYNWTNSPYMGQIMGTNGSSVKKFMFARMVEQARPFDDYADFKAWFDGKALPKLLEWNSNSGEPHWFVLRNADTMTSNGFMGGYDVRNSMERFLEGLEAKGLDSGKMNSYNFEAFFNSNYDQDVWYDSEISAKFPGGSAPVGTYGMSLALNDFVPKYAWKNATNPLPDVLLSNSDWTAVSTAIGQSVKSRNDAWTSIVRESLSEGSVDAVCPGEGAGTSCDTYANVLGKSVQKLYAPIVIPNYGSEPQYYDAFWAGYDLWNGAGIGGYAWAKFALRYLNAKKGFGELDDYAEFSLAMTKMGAKFVAADFTLPTEPEPVPVGPGPTEGGSSGSSSGGWATAPSITASASADAVLETAEIAALLATADGNEEQDYKASKYSEFVNSADFLRTVETTAEIQYVDLSK